MIDKNIPNFGIQMFDHKHESALLLLVPTLYSAGVSDLFTLLDTSRRYSYKVIMPNDRIHTLSRKFYAISKDKSKFKSSTIANIRTLRKAINEDLGFNSVIHKMFTASERKYLLVQQSYTRILE